MKPTKQQYLDAIVSRREIVIKGFTDPIGLTCAEKVEKSRLESIIDEYEAEIYRPAFEHLEAQVARMEALAREVRGLLEELGEAS